MAVEAVDLFSDSIWGCWVGPATAEQASNLHAESRYEAYLDTYLSLQDKKWVSFLYFLRLEPGLACQVGHTGKQSFCAAALMMK